MIEVTEALLDRAEQRVFAYALRAAGAIHVRRALVGVGVIPGSPVQFWTADRRQADTAFAEGLDVRLIG